MVNEPTQSTSAESIQRGYDVREVNVRALGWFVAGFILSGAIILLVLWWFVGYLAYRNQSMQPPISPLLETSVVTPEPRIQPSAGQLELPWQDLLKLRVDEEKILSTYGWVDRTHNLARIPVNRAADLALQQHLFPHTQSASQESPRHVPR